MESAGNLQSWICRDDLNHVIAAFVRDKDAEQGVFDTENTPARDDAVADGEDCAGPVSGAWGRGCRGGQQRAVAAISLVQQAQKQEDKVHANLGLLRGVRKFVLHVRELSVDLIDTINPFGEAYSLLARSSNAETLRQMQEKIAVKRVVMSEEEAVLLAERARTFKRERNRLPSLRA